MATFVGLDSLNGQNLHSQLLESVVFGHDLVMVALRELEFRFRSPDSNSGPKVK